MSTPQLKRFDDDDDMVLVVVVFGCFGFILVVVLSLVKILVIPLLQG